MSTASLSSAAPAQARAMAFIRKQIDAQGLRDGDPLPSETALSRELSVSRGTVRAAYRVLQEQGLIESGQGRVRRVRRSRGATAMASLMQKTVLVGSHVIDPLSFWHRGWDTHTQSVFSADLRDAGYHVLNLSPDTLGSRELEELVADGLGGLILCPSVSDSSAGRRLAGAARARGVAVVVESDEPVYETHDRVVPDHAEGSRRLVELLGRRNRRRILPLFPAGLDQWWVEQRLIGYRRGMAELGLAPLNAARIPEFYESDDLAAERVDHHVKVLTGYLYTHIHGSAPVDAIMATTDRQVPVIAKALKSMGLRVNHDLDLVGYDAVWPDVQESVIDDAGPVATIDKRNGEIGKAITQTLIRRIGPDAPDTPIVRRIEPDLITLQPS